MRQNAPEGRFSGRAGKLIDGCYTHWVWGCWPLILGVLDGPTHHSRSKKDEQFETDENTAVLMRHGWMASREGVAR